MPRFSDFEEVPEDIGNQDEGPPVELEGAPSTGRRRLRYKTAACANHGYTARALQKLQEHKVKMFQFKKAQTFQKSENKSARLDAIKLLAMQPPPGAFGEDERHEVGPITNPHPSHRIIALKGSSSTIYCRNCGAWAARERLQLLAAACAPLKVGNRHNLRLLQCGVMPSPSAKIPSHLKQVHRRRGRRSRW